MMIAPLFAGEPGRRVVIPAGADWHDFWTGAIAKAGTEMDVEASTQNIPVYVKTGSVMPWADVGQHAGAPETRRLAARVYGDGSLPFELLTGTQSLKLTWSNGHGSASGGKETAGGYEVYDWKRIG